MAKQLTCPQCKAEFIKEYPKQLYCSRMCNRKYDELQKLKKVERVCTVCSKTYTNTARTVQIAKGPSMCNPCTRKAVAPITQRNRQCLVCGENFKAIASTTKLCSPLCEQEFKNKKAMKFKPETQKDIVTIDRVPCSVCAFGKSSTYAELGWECTLNARVCAPFTLKTLFKEKEAVHGKA